MKLISPSVKILQVQPKDIKLYPKDQEELLKVIYKQIEIAGRTCYKSEDKITDTSAKEFTERMIKSGHTAMLEHGTVYLKCPISIYYTEDGEQMNIDNPLDYYLDNHYSKGEEIWNDDNSKNGYCYVTTNYRVIIENNALRDLQYICEPTDYHAKRTMVRFICDRGVSHELVRHRVFSFAQESSRFCNYSKDKFSGVTFVKPSWMPDNIYDVIKQSSVDVNKLDEYWYCWFNSIWESEMTYISLLNNYDNKIPDKRYKTKFKGNPWTPQQARSVLPNALKTEVIMTGFISDWRRFFKLRDDKHAHPDMQVLAHKLHEDFKRNDL